MRRKCTVLQLLPALHAGGVERSTIEITQALTAAGARALVVSAGGRLLPELHGAGGTHVSLPVGKKSPLTLRYVFALRKLFAQQQVDIVHARSRLPAWLAWWALRGMDAAQRPAFVTTVHGLNSPSRYSAVMCAGQRVICVSNTVRAYVLQHYPQTDAAKLRVISRGVDLAAFVPTNQQAARAQWAVRYPALGGNGPLLLLAGRGTRLKGHHQALALLQQLRNDGEDVRLWLLGAQQDERASYVQELIQYAQAQGLHDALAITAPTEAIASAYAAADIVLQLSQKPEAFGRTVVEALAVGRCVLGWNHGGVGELLAQFFPQGAVPAFDTQALYQRALQCIRQPAIATVCPQIRARLPTLAAMQAATLAVYDELL